MQADLSKRGTSIFLRIFEISPRIKAVFNIDSDLDGEGVSRDPVLTRHATRFMHAIGSAIDNLDDLETSVAPTFISLGKHHLKFDGLKDEYFDVFSGAMMYVWRESFGDGFTPEIRTAWSRLFDFILQHLKLGRQIASKEDKDAQWRQGCI